MKCTINDVFFPAYTITALGRIVSVSRRLQRTLDRDADWLLTAV